MNLKYLNLVKLIITGIFKFYVEHSFEHLMNSYPVNIDFCEMTFTLKLNKICKLKVVSLQNKPLQGMAPTECLLNACLLTCFLTCLLACFLACLLACSLLSSLLKSLLSSLLSSLLKSLLSSLLNSFLSSLLNSFLSSLLSSFKSSLKSSP